MKRRSCRRTGPRPAGRCRTRTSTSDRWDRRASVRIVMTAGVDDLGVEAQILGVDVRHMSPSSDKGYQYTRCARPPADVDGAGDPGPSHAKPPSLPAHRCLRRPRAALSWEPRRSGPGTSCEVLGFRAPQTGSAAAAIPVPGTSIAHHVHDRTAVACQLVPALRDQEWRIRALRARKNVGGELRSLVYGARWPFTSTDRKEALLSFLPGSSAYSLGR